MTLQINKKEKKILLFGSIVLLLIFIFLYFNFLQPLRADVQSKGKQLKTNEKLYSSVLNQKTDVKETVVENTLYLQKRLPVKALVDQFILDLQKAETMSNSLILQMVFGSENKEEEENVLDNIKQGFSVIQGEENSESKENVALPTGIEKITVNLLIKSPSYFELEKFLETVENLERIVTVESINFSGNPEVTTLGQKKTDINYQVSLSLYYMPDLEDLQDELPKFESGKPANKRNPLTQFDDLTDDTGE